MKNTGPISFKKMTIYKKWSQIHELNSFLMYTYPSSCFYVAKLSFFLSLFLFFFQAKSTQYSITT